MTKPEGNRMDIDTLVNGYRIDVSELPSGRCAIGWQYTLVDPTTGDKRAEGLGGMSAETARKRGEDAARGLMPAGVSLPQGFYYWHATALRGILEYGDPHAYAGRGTIRSDTDHYVRQLKGWGMVDDDGTLTVAGEAVAVFYQRKRTR